MSTIDTVRHTGENEIATWLHHGYARVAAAIAGFTYAKSATPVEQARSSAAAAVRAARLFAQAVCEDSNLAMDWLWCAEQMTDAAARRYCIERALTIDPDSELARHALSELRSAATSDAASLLAQSAASGSNA